MLEHLSTYIIHLIQSSGYIGVFILMTLESALLPIPSEVTMTFAGFLAFKGSLSLPLVILAGTLGNLVGSLLAYILGIYLGEHAVRNLVRKFGKLVLLTEGDYETSVRWFHKYGEPVVFFSRILPAVRTFISLPAGVYKMNLTKFSVYTTVGSLIWSAFLAYVGFILGEKWNSLEPYYRKFEIIIVVGLIILVFLYLNHKLKIVEFKKS